MARIIGKIESLKSLKSELEKNGISRFNSVKGINDFLSNYNSERLVILNNASDKLEKEYFERSTNLKQRIQDKSEQIIRISAQHNKRICRLTWLVGCRWRKSDACKYSHPVWLSSAALVESTRLHHRSFVLLKSNNFWSAARSASTSMESAQKYPCGARNSVCMYVSTRGFRYRAPGTPDNTFLGVVRPGKLIFFVPKSCNRRKNR